MKHSYRIIAVALLSSVSATALASPALAAEPRDERIKSLEQKLDILVDEIRALKQEQAADNAAKETLTNQVIDLKRGQAAAIAEGQNQKAAEPKFSIASGRPTFSSADGKSAIAIRALLQYDGSYFSQNSRAASGTDLNSGSNLRRARIGIDGKIFGGFTYSFLYDMGGSGVEGSKVSDAYLQYDGLAPFHFRTGSFVTPGGIEDQTSTASLLFLERAGPTDLARGIAGADGRKNILSIFTYENDYYAAATWSLARAGDAAVFDQQQAAVGRLSYRFFKNQDANLILSGSGAYVFKIADAAASPVGASAITFQEGPENTVDGTRLISTGGINARKAHWWGVETAGNWKTIYGQGGYFGYGIKRRASALPNPDFHGWYVQGSWLLTGESHGYNATTATFDAPKVAAPFDFKGKGLGAWELTARYSVVDLNFNAGVVGSNVGATGGVRGGRQEGFTAGINWYPNSTLRFLVNYQHLDIDRLAATAPFRSIGQKVDIITGRAQLAF